MWVRRKSITETSTFWAQLSREPSACSLPAAFKGRCSALVKIKDTEECRIKWKCQQPRSASRTQVSPAWYDRRTADVMMSLGHRRASMAVVLYFPTPAISFKHPSSPQLSFPVPLSQSSPANPAFTPPFLQLASQLTHLSSSSQPLLFPTSAEHSAEHTVCLLQDFIFSLFSCHNSVTWILASLCSSILEHHCQE